MRRPAWMLAAALELAAGAVLPGCRTEPRAETSAAFKEGTIAARARDFAAAIARLTTAIESSREEFFFTEAYLARGECFLEAARASSDRLKSEEQLALALKDFDSVLARYDLFPEAAAHALAMKGNALLSRGDVKGSEESFERILGLDLAGKGAEHRLEAYRRLGWILFGRAEAMLKPNLTADEELESMERFRQAQDRFSGGLQIDAQDGECNLGKGMCLHFRKQDAEAITYFERSTVSSHASKVPNPRGHYFLALALESRKGFYRRALHHYRSAVEQDATRSYTPLYAHLLEVLPVYLSPADPEFTWFLDAILSYRNEERDYWSAVEGFAEALASGEAAAGRELGLFARAVARARSGRIDTAVEDALPLQARPDFGKLAARVFPPDPPRPDYSYGRAAILLAARRHEELEGFFAGEGFRGLAATATHDDYYKRTLAIEGRNIVARWLEETAKAGPVTTPEGKLERDRRLGKARDGFQVYLERYPEDHQVRMALGEVQELMESFTNAFVSYAFIASEVKDHPDALRRILRLHREKLLPEKVYTEAWNLLRSYGGEDAEIAGYVLRTRGVIESDLLLYCAACGRKAAEGEGMCPECGRRIGVKRGP